MLNLKPIRESGSLGDDNQTISTHELDELEFKATDSTQRMDVNLQRTYNQMRSFMKSAANQDYLYSGTTNLGRNKQDSLDPALLPYNHLANPSQTHDSFIFNQLKTNNMLSIQHNL